MSSQFQKTTIPTFPDEDPVIDNHYGLSACPSGDLNEHAKSTNISPKFPPSILEAQNFVWIERAI